MGEVKSTEDEELNYGKGIKIFGRDIREIPCFRDSFIYGICGGVVGGLVCFMATSKITFSTHIAFASLWGTVFLYWFPCRYKYESKNLQFQYVKETLAAQKKGSRVASSETENSKV